MTEHAVVIAGGGPTGLMLAGELALAALAAGDYVMKLTVAGPDGPVDVYTGIRVVQ